METKTVILTLLGVFLLVVVIFMIKKYNILQRLSQKVSEAHSNILVSMKKRMALANKLIGIASGYGDHEKLAHINISQNTTNKPGIQQGAMTLNRLMALAQNFPELRANETYQKLMQQLQEIETDLQTKRENYNGVVRV
jgi:LemA protein